MSEETMKRMSRKYIFHNDPTSAHIDMTAKSYWDAEGCLDDQDGGLQEVEDLIVPLGAMGEGAESLIMTNNRDDEKPDHITVLILDLLRKHPDFIEIPHDEWLLL